VPAYGNRRYTCYGRIMCRFSVLNPILTKLIEKLEEAHARFLVNGRMLLAVRSKFASLHPSGNFSKPVCFHVSSLSDPIGMRLRLTYTQILPISASPSSITSFVKFKRLDWSGSRLNRRQRTDAEREPPLVKQQLHQPSVPVETIEVVNLGNVTSKVSLFI
jgi:hypothetical protein